MSGRSSAAAWTGLGAGAGALIAAGALLHRTLEVTLEIRRYADDIAAAGGEIARHTDVGVEVVRLGALASRIRAEVAGSPAAGADGAA